MKPEHELKQLFMDTTQLLNYILDININIIFCVLSPNEIQHPCFGDFPKGLARTG